MQDKCPGCSKAFVAGDEVFACRLEQVRKGEKSGVLGFYPSRRNPEGEEERIHFHHTCIEVYFNPEHGYAYDDVVAAIRKEIWEEFHDDRYLDGIPEVRDPPVCLWCKQEDGVWKHEQRDMDIFNCMRCRKLWDHDENELAFDPQRGYYIVEYRDEDSFNPD